ncbi:UNVERIFIED_CONTAM: hypothetical protein Sradi_0258700 [Sesamum radiatum]|uniref:PRA1 family protein n=1 Tax=Sesamum radiatum TaxID=300843 RepID=A0AAW2W1R8_SESRA
MIHSSFVYDNSFIFFFPYKDAIPRPIARISVTIAAVMVSLFLLKSFLSTAFFALAVMGLSYFTFIALNKDEGPKGGGGTTSLMIVLKKPEELWKNTNKHSTLFIGLLFPLLW